MDDLTTLRAKGWLKCWRVLQFFEIVFVGAVPDVHLSFEGATAFLAVFPVASMPFVVMSPTEGVAIVISAAAVSCIREWNILAIIVADPVPAAICLSDLSNFATQAAGRLLTLGFRCSHLNRTLYQGLY